MDKLEESYKIRVEPDQSHPHLFITFIIDVF